MAIIKYAETSIAIDQVHSEDVALSDPKVRERFKKMASDLKKVAPKASDFTYFSCVMMHAAEASLVDNSGEIKKSASGQKIIAKWDINEKTGSWKWSCSDPNTLPYKNRNGDIFPEIELKKAYRQWVGKPLCKDHNSSSVDGIRGLIIDTHWDDTNKRVIALCALDKKNYPDLARKVETGYATNVSMGTAVGRSICYECGNVARVEAEYCSHVKNRTTYGEINVDLSPIELSLVVTGADPKAKLRSIIASLDTYSQEKENQVNILKSEGCILPGEADRLNSEIKELRAKLTLATSSISKMADVDGDKIRNLIEVVNSPNVDQEVKDLANKQLFNELNKEEKTPVPEAGQEQQASDTASYGLAGNYAMTGGRGSPMEDPQSSGPINDYWSIDGRGSRLADFSLDAQALIVKGRLDAMEKTLRELTTGIQTPKNSRTYKEDYKMANLQERARARRKLFEKKAYHQGGGGLNEPQTYPVDDLAEKVRDEDKQMVGQGMESGADGMHPGYESYGNELSLKQKLSRAELEQRRFRREALLTNAENVISYSDKDGGRYVEQNGKINKVEQDIDDLFADEPEEESEGDDGLFDNLTEAQMKNLLRKAYFQGGGGVNEPQTYPVDGLSEKVRKEDKQMVGQGMESGVDGMHPGYESYGNESELKKRINRAELNAKFIVRYANSKKTKVNHRDSHWDFYADGKKILTASGKDVYEDQLGKYWSFFASEEYGRKVMAELRKNFTKTAYMLTGKIIKSAEDLPVGPGAPGAEPLGKATGPRDGTGPRAQLMGMQEGADGVDEDDSDTEATKEEVDKALAKVEQDIDSLKSLLGVEGFATKEREELPEVEDTTTASSKLRVRVAELIGGLDNVGDELATLSDVLENKMARGEAQSDDTLELIRIASESLEATEDLHVEASILIEAAKKKEDKKDEKEDEKEDKKGKKAKKDKKDEKEDEEDEKEDKKEKKAKKDEEEEEDDKKSKKGKKSKAEIALERILMSRASKRRHLVRIAMGLEDEDEDELDEETSIDLKDIAGEEEDLEERVKLLEEELDKLKGLSAEDLDVDEDEDEEMEADDDDDDDTIEKLLSELSKYEEDDEENELVPFDDEEDELSSFEEEEDEEEDFESRASWRKSVITDMEKLAAADYQLHLDTATNMDTDMVPAAHPAGGFTLGGLDTNVSDEGAKFERIDEIQAKIMRTLSDPQTRVAAERLGNLLKAGAITESDLFDENKMKALAVDPEAANYWKQYFGEGDPDSKEFGQDLVKELEAKKVEASADLLRVKMARAYDLAFDMMNSGIIPSDSATINQQVDEIMTFDDKAFDSFKNSIARLRGNVKTASQKAVQVGIQSEVGGGGHAATKKPANLVGQLGRLWK